jgi:hypothetical protein
MGVAPYRVETLKNEYYILTMDDYIRQICGTLIQII